MVGAEVHSGRHRALHARVPVLLYQVRHGEDGSLELTGYGASAGAATGAATGAARGATRGAAAAPSQPHRTFRAYNLHLDQQQPESHRIWILKPLGGFNQVGRQPPPRRPQPLGVPPAHRLHTAW